MNWIVLGASLHRVLGTHPWMTQAPGGMPESGAEGMTTGMMVGAGVLILTQLIVVGAAVAWHRHHQRNSDRHDSASTGNPGHIR